LSFRGTRFQVANVQGRVGGVLVGSRGALGGGGSGSSGSWCGRCRFVEKE